MTGEIQCRVCGSSHLPGACPRLRRPDGKTPLSPPGARPLTPLPPTFSPASPLRAPAPSGLDGRETREQPIISDVRPDSRPDARPDVLPDTRTDLRPIMRSDPRSDFLSDVLSEIPTDGRGAPSVTVQAPTGAVPIVIANSGAISVQSFELPPGTMVGEYKVVRKIGGGAMGVVYQAMHPLIERAIAIKVLSGAHLGSKNAAARLIQEGHASNRMRHRNVVDVYSVGTLPDGRLYLVMEYIDGPNLQKLIETHGPLGYEEALPIADQVLAGLGAAHEAGVVHRDLKPENIILRLDPDGRSLSHAEVKILDFGLAKEIQPGGNERAPATEGVPIGTPAFMSPEQCRGLSNLDARSDLYSVGVILYWLFTGKLPFDAPSYLDVIRMQLSTAPRRPSELCDMPQALEEIILKLLEKKPEDRYPTAEAVRMVLKVCDEARAWIPSAPRTAGAGPTKKESRRSVVDVFSADRPRHRIEESEPRPSAWRFVGPAMVAGGVLAVVALAGLGEWRSLVQQRLNAEAEARVAAAPPTPAPAPKVAPVEAPLPGVVDRRQALTELRPLPPPRPAPVAARAPAPSDPNAPVTPSGHPAPGAAAGKKDDAAPEAGAAAPVKAKANGKPAHKLGKRRRRRAKPT